MGYALFCVLVESGWRLLVRGTSDKACAPLLEIGTLKRLEHQRFKTHPEMQSVQNASLSPQVRVRLFGNYSGCGSSSSDLNAEPDVYGPIFTKASKALKSGGAVLRHEFQLER